MNIENNKCKDLSHIYRVDVELQSFCNRKCDWCPNKTFLRNFKESMPDDVYVSLLHQLSDANFGDIQIPYRHITKLSFIGYQEIFSNIELLKTRLQEAKTLLNDFVIITTSSNGDYITKEMLDELQFISIAIQDYDCMGKAYWEEKLKEFGAYNIHYDDNTNMLYATCKNFVNITIVLNWTKTRELENRGGYFKQGDLPNMEWANDMKQRTMPCPEPEYFINIYYDGSVTPCCHIRPDNPEHKDYILGNIKDTPIIDIYYSEKAENFRKRLREPNGDYPEPCKYCQKVREENCFGSPSGWDYIPSKYKEV